MGDLAPATIEATDTPKTGTLIRRRKKDGRRHNALTSGLRSSIGLLPPSARFISRRRNTACRQLQSEIRRVHRREPNWYELRAVEEYHSWFTLKELLDNWITIAGHEMTADELLGYQRKAAYASTVLRTIGERLGLNQSSESPPLPSQQEPLTPEQEQTRKAAVELNRQAIEHLRQAERSEQAIKALAGELVPPSAFPDVEAVPIDADTNGSHANGGTIPHAGLTVDSIDHASLDAGDEMEGQS